MNHQVVIVTGGSSGIGLEAAKALAASGCTVYEFSRKKHEQERIFHISCDVTDEEQVRSAVMQVLNEQGRIDILVNNAGFGISGAAEFTPSEYSHAQMETNLFGMDNMTRAVLPFMREQGCGRIVFVSSVAGVIPIPFQLWYSVSKAGVKAYSMALQNEVRSFGITTCCILPGDICTGFTAARKKLDDPVYSARLKKSVESMEKDERNGIPSDYAGKFVSKFALRKRSRPLVVLGGKYRFFCILIKFLPARLSNYIVGIMY